MECEYYMSERYHFAEPRQEATGSISVRCAFAGNLHPRRHSSGRCKRPEQTTPTSRCRGFSETRCSTLSAASALQSRSEEHTSELQSRLHPVCRLLLEKKKKNTVVSVKAIDG